MTVMFFLAGMFGLSLMQLGKEEFYRIDEDESPIEDKDLMDRVVLCIRFIYTLLTLISFAVAFKQVWFIFIPFICLGVLPKEIRKNMFYPFGIIRLSALFFCAGYVV